MNNNDSFLAKSIKIGPHIVPNRFAINAMEGCDAEPDGSMSKRTCDRYKRLFEGGAGLIVFEAVTMQYESRARKKQISLEKKNVAAMAKTIRDLKAINKNALLIYQLSHSGEISSGEFSKRVCVKPIPGFEGEVIDDFVLASKILHDIGADGVDIKLCHGYLGSSILRPYNDRKWKYGGTVGK